MADMESTSVQVVVRMRPLNERELKGNTLPVVTASTEKKEVTVIKGSGTRQQRTTYNFDNVLTSFSTQSDVFSQTIAPVLNDVLGGFECTMFAYGQTGTGKTHTMEGNLKFVPLSSRRPNLDLLFWFPARPKSGFTDSCALHLFLLC